MKSHFCKAEGTTLSYENECNWCGEKEIEQSEEQVEQSQLADASFEPVAWWNGKETVWFEHELITDGPIGECKIPLYVTPVRTKDLSDDEIHVQAYEHLGFDETGFYCGSEGLCDFARAVISADRAKNSLCERTK